MSTGLSLPIVVHFGLPLRRLSDTEFYEFCLLNRDLRLERTADGDLIIMPPTGGSTGARNLELASQLHLWAKQDGTGIAFDSSTGFKLPNGATRSPDVAWLRRERWQSLSRQEQEQFPPLAPDFVAELRSQSDSLVELRAKMEEYRACGVSLGWLIDPVNLRVEVYRPDQRTETIDQPSSISADPFLPGFVLSLSELWGGT